jgi:hypothetical protein
MSSSKSLSNEHKHTINIKHYINPKIIYHFDTKKEMTDWLVKGQSFVDENHGKIGKCVCKTWKTYEIYHEKLKSKD